MWACVHLRHAFILKLNPPDKHRLVENEHFFMRMAKDCGLLTAETRLVHDREGHFLDRYPSDKYRISCSDIAKGLRETCLAPIPETARFLRLVAFSYLIAKGDLHSKNVSILANGPAGGFRFSPAYDLLTTLPYGDRRMALKFEGRDDNLRRSGFVAFGERFGVKPAATHRILDELCDRVGPWIARLEEVRFEPRKTRHLRDIMEKRREDLGTG
jgi:serine/threonine-protein kinase HipA